MTSKFNVCERIDFNDVWCVFVEHNMLHIVLEFLINITL